MKAKIIIRSETGDDITTISEVTAAAFKTLPISNHTEQFIIAALRVTKALTISLVAELDGRVVGHIAFSPVTISDGCPNWYGLGPVAVLPEYQRQGIGTALMQDGLSRLKGLNAQGCCLVGHPEYYRRFGFRNIPGLLCEGVPQEVFFGMSFDGHTPQGVVEFHEGFKASGPPEREYSGSRLSILACGADSLAHAGIPTKIDAKHAIAQNKVMVIDGEVVITGSFNFTKAAKESNAENLPVIRDKGLAARYAENWKEHEKHAEVYVGKGQEPER